MIDYFALLDQPQAPWLDLAELKDAYHKKTLQAHPDAQANPSKKCMSRKSSATIPSCPVSDSISVKSPDPN